MYAEVVDVPRPVGGRAWRARQWGRGGQATGRGGRARQPGVVGSRVWRVRWWWRAGGHERGAGERGADEEGAGTVAVVEGVEGISAVAAVESVEGASVEGTVGGRA